MTPFEPPRIAAGGYTPGVAIYRVKDGYLDMVGFPLDSLAVNLMTILLQELDLPSEGPSSITSDIAWAPVMGRSYHLVAVASREKRFRVSLSVRVESFALTC